jgi:hypothetical protein
MFGMAGKEGGGLLSPKWVSKGEERISSCEHEYGILLRKQELIPRNYTLLEEARELAGWQAEAEVLAGYTALLQVKG